MELAKLSLADLAALLSTLHPETIKFALRIDPLIAYVDKHCSYGKVGIEVKAGEFGYVDFDQGWRKGDEITL